MQNSFQSIQLLLEYIKDYENKSEYVELLMLDLAEILDSVPQEIYFFLNNKKGVRQESNDNDSGEECNIERPLKS